MEKVLRVFYEFPEKSFTVREVSKLARVPRATLHKVLLRLKKRGLVDNDCRAERNLLFKVIKTNYFVEKIVESGLIDFLVEKLNPSVIILFGGVRKGESDKDSDIDIFVGGFVDKQLDLSKYEKKLGHKIELFVYEHIKKVNENLRTNILNGIKLHGYLDIK